MNLQASPPEVEVARAAAQTQRARAAAYGGAGLLAAAPLWAVLWWALPRESAALRMAALAALAVSVLAATAAGWLAVLGMRRAGDSAQGAVAALVAASAAPILVADALIYLGWLLGMRIVAYLYWAQGRFAGLELWWRAVRWSTRINRHELAETWLLVLMLSSWLAVLVDWYVIRAIWRLMRPTTDATPMVVYPPTSGPPEG